MPGNPSGLASPLGTVGTPPDPDPELDPEPGPGVEVVLLLIPPPNPVHPKLTRLGLIPLPETPLGSTLTPVSEFVVGLEAEAGPS